MFQLAIIAIAITSTFAQYASKGGSLSGGYVPSYTAPSYSAPQYQQFSYGNYAAAPAEPVTYDGAIQTRRTVEVRNVPYEGTAAQPQIIEVSPDNLPVQVHFKTASSRVNVQQSHTPGLASQVEHASFQDEPHRVIHEVVKPVIQEVREIIQPYRRVTQEIRPVIEEVHTVVHKGEPRPQLAPVQLVQTQQIAQQTFSQQPLVQTQLGQTKGRPLLGDGYGAAAGGLALNAYKGARAAKAAKA